MNRLIKYEEGYALTGQDVVNIAKPNKVKYMLYNSLSRYNSIDEVLHGTDGVVILLEIKDGKSNVGHFVCIFKNKQGINYFDSYAMGMDKDLSLMHENPKIFQKLFRNKKVKQNKKKYQKLKKDIQSCGRWCGVRLRFHELTDNEFHKLMTSSKYEPDDLVSLMTLLISPQLKGHELVKYSNVHLGGIVDYQGMNQYQQRDHKHNYDHFRVNGLPYHI